MKKLIYTALLTLVVVGMASCSDKGKCDRKADKQGDKIEVYSGVLPGADVSGILYTLDMEFDDDKNYTDGDYKLTQVYMTADSTGMKDGKVFTSEGDFKEINGTGANATAKYLKLTPDRDSQGETLYFKVTSDSTLMLVNAQLEEPTDTALNYTLRLKSSQIER